MAVLIFANGKISEGAWIQSYIQNPSVVIAANGGLSHLIDVDLIPDLLIGDFDSVDSKLTESSVRGGAHSIRHRADKDKTDLELALLYAQQHFVEPILVFGATGGRIDHSLANLMLLAHPDLLGQDITYIDLGYRIWVVHDRTKITGEPGDLISLIPVNGEAYVETTNGLRWPLNNETLEFGPTRGVSNELSDKTAEIVLISGIIICIHTKKRIGLFE